MSKALWLDSVNQKKILKYKKLEGGVSSEVYKVVTKKKVFCIKRSLRKLLVKKEWIVDQNRLYYEFLWLKHCKKILIENIPETFEYNDEKKYVVMEYFDDKKFKTLKELYFQKKISFNAIKSISRNLFDIHLLSSNEKTKKIFKKNNTNFYDLRLDPYFNEVARVYPNLKKIVEKINRDYKYFSSTLVHGDFSPKNILINNNKIIYLDAECCNYGDPVFDLVFFSNHLIIKSIYFKSEKSKFLKAYKLFYDQYLNSLSKIDKKNYLVRIFNMTPIMLLARVDGKSPVEYIISDKLKNVIREKSFKIINSKILHLNDIVRIINEK